MVSAIQLGLNSTWEVVCGLRAQTVYEHSKADCEDGNNDNHICLLLEEKYST